MNLFISAQILTRLGSRGMPAETYVSVDYVPSFDAEVVELEDTLA